MRKKVKSEIVVSHFVDYYSNNECVKSELITDVRNEDMFRYWNIQKHRLSESDNKFIEVDDFTAITKCVMSYDYAVERLIERVVIKH